MTEFYAGLDLGAAADPSALCILERVDPHEDIVEDADGGSTLVEVPSQYQVRYLRRFELGTSYPEVVSRVADMLNREPLRDYTTLVADYTGVGRPVVEMLREADLSPVAVTITAGEQITEHEDGGYGVPKHVLIIGTLVLMQAGRLKLSRKIPETAALVAEMQAFRRKIINPTRGGTETFNAREGKHDDLLLALCLACWRAEQFAEPRLWGAMPTEPEASFSRTRGLPDWLADVEMKR